MNVLALFVGGFVGTVLRYGIGELFPAQSNGLPWSTLWINLAGSLFLGWFFTFALNRSRLRLELRLGLGTGLAGAFTTFSTFAVQTSHLFNGDKHLLAFFYVGLSVLGGLFMTIIGVSIARVQTNKSKGNK